MLFSDSPDPHEPLKAGYEKKDANLKGVLIVTLLSILFVVLAIVALQNFFVATEEQIVNQVVLQPESAALRELRARETDQLSSYAVLDSARGIYRIPIDRAMKLLADEDYDKK